MPVTSTNIAVEVRASVRGLRMALQLRMITDSMLVAQTIEDDLVAGRRADLVATLLFGQN